MATFNPAVLVPATQVAELSKAQAGRSMKDVALANIDKQIALLADAKIEGKRTFRVVGDKSAFQVRVGNQALTLETVKVKDTTVEVKEMSAPSAQLKDALLYYRDRIAKGNYDAALAKLDTARVARVEKMKTTRAAKPKTEKKAS